MAQRKSKKTTSQKTNHKKPRQKRTTKKASPLLKFEIIGILFILAGLYMTVGIIGIDTGRFGYSLDGFLAYGFGVGRIVVSLSCVVLGLKYIVNRKALPITATWLVGAWIFALFLGAVHVLFIPGGMEFAPVSLRAGGGVVGAAVASILRNFFGQVGAVLILLAALIVTALVKMKWSISKPVAVATDIAGEEMARVSDRAVEGLHGASQSIKGWHDRRKIFDLQKEEEEEMESPATELEAAVPEKPAVPAVQPVVRDDLPDGVNEYRINDTAAAVPEYAPEKDEYDGGTYEEDAPYDWVDDEDASEPVQKPLAQVTDVLNEDMSNLKPVEVEDNTAAADMAGDGASAVPNAEAMHPYHLPPVDILHFGKPPAPGLSDEVQHNATILQDTLQSFNIDAKITNASQGPAVTRYELEPAPGVKVSKIVHLSDDIALKLAATDIRIEAPIPGKAAVGIEVPNKKLTGVNLRDVLDTDTFHRAAGGVPVCLGKDIAGNPVVADLTKMPHLLVAGSTGSGKSVCINTFIASILFKQRPEDVKLILVDPKTVELSNYNGIPHLLTPVVTDPKKAASVLRWAVREMDDRYKKFAATKTRDISRYNELHPEDAMPFVVIIIDELADLMMVASKDVEESICRLAQKARACGMHLVLATQRPSVDVLTGLIKANVPSRIAFAVSSQIDSRTILDMAGAEKLIGKGDMLFYPMGASKPIRVQGAFISDGEIDDMVEFIKAQAQPQYNEEVQKAQNDEEEGEGDFFEDELMPQAIDMVLETGQASTSMLQRRFRIGYTRAARMIDMMEAMHIVGPADGNRPREILMNADEVEAKYFSN